MGPEAGAARAAAAALQLPAALRPLAGGAFVTGTDTGVGKTLVTCALLRALARPGLRVAGCKPVASGAERGAQGLVNEDVERLRAASHPPLGAHEVCARIFEPALAPHIAAAMAGVGLDVDGLEAACLRLRAHADAVVVEGVGGFLVPLSDQQDMGDLAARLALPVVLVVGLRLGCINHALLTAEAIGRRGLVLAGWVGNRIDPGMARVEENLATLAARLPGPCLGVLPWMEGEGGCAGREQRAADILSDAPAGA